MSFIKSLIQSNESINITKFTGEGFEVKFAEPVTEEVQKICILDVETTGKNRQEDRIVELAMKVVLVDKETGEIAGITNDYESFNDPGIPITEEASKINGITDDMISGESIDWEKVNDIFYSSDIIVAHNASFDRSFLDRELKISQNKLWACSMNDIDWMERGFNSNKQELLCIWHGFYYESHRAMNDVDALIHLITHDFYSDKKPVLELISNSVIPYYKIAALKSPFETKNQLKAHDYYWDSVNKYWWKRINLDDIETEREWLTENVYDGHFLGAVEEILITDKYKE